MPVQPEVVWRWLVSARHWPDWYPEFRDVVIEGGAAELRAGSRFRWRTFGVSLRSEVLEFVPPERLGWTAQATGIDAYHAWLIERLPSGCRVRSEETQNGLVARFNHFLRPSSVARIHQLWLERLAEKAKTGLPGNLPG